MIVVRVCSGRLRHATFTAEMKHGIIFAWESSGIAGWFKMSALICPIHPMMNVSNRPYRKTPCAGVPTGMVIAFQQV